MHLLIGMAVVLALGTAARAQEKREYQCAEDHSVGLHPIDHDYKPTKFNLRKFKLQFHDSKVRVRYDLSLNRADEHLACSIPDEKRSGVLQCADSGQMFVFDKDQEKLHFAQIYLSGEGVPQAPLLVSTASCRQF